MTAGPSISEQSVLALVDSVQRAALDERLWPEVLQQFIVLTESQAATFCVLRDGDRIELPRFDYLNFNTRHIDEYLDFMAPEDPTNQYLVAHPGARIVHDATFITEREKDRHLFYDWHEKFSDTRHRVVGMIYPAPNIQSGITIHRTRSVGDFEPEHLRRFEALFSHVERALQIAFRLGTVGTLYQASLDALDRTAEAVIVLGTLGRVLFANAAARRLSDARDGVVLADGTVHLTTRAEDQRLQTMIAAAMKCRTSVQHGPGGAMHVPRAAGKRPLSVVVSPLAPGAFALTSVCPAVMIAIADPDSRMIPPEPLRRLFGLTRSEARLAACLANGEDLRSAALSLGMSYRTARTHLAAIFQKTGTRRQGELIRLLMTAVPPQHA